VLAWVRSNPPSDAKIHNAERTPPPLKLPLRLAWCLTIHKAQEMSLPRLIVTLPDDEMTQGGTLVALSRCTSLGGVIVEDVSYERFVLKINSRKRDNLVALYKSLRKRASETTPGVWTHAALDNPEFNCLNQFIGLSIHTSDNNHTLTIPLNMPSWPTWS
jgi:hypothetical protein